jgi:dTMP kinase
MSGSGGLAASGEAASAGAVAPSHDLRGVLRITDFRRLWIAMSVSSLGDWLGLLAITAMASALARDSGRSAEAFAISGVFMLRLAPAVIFGPIAGVVADRLNRRLTMVIGDVLRFLLFLSIPLVGELWWLFTATFLIEIVSLFWIPAKEATLPNLVPRERLEAANQLNLIAAYGTAPIAAGVFTMLSLVSGVLAAGITFFEANPVALALYLNAGTFLFAAAMVYRLDIPVREQPPGAHSSVLGTLVEGWQFVGGTPLVRGLVVGMLGAFAAGGAVVGLAKILVRDLEAGDPGYGVLFGTVFVGLALGMFLGPRLLAGLSRRRLFGMTIVGAGILLSLIALIPDMVIVTLLTLFLGAMAGIAWVIGYTLIGLEVEDEVRGRTFAFVQSMARVMLVLVLAVAPLAAAAIGEHSRQITRGIELTYSGAAITIFLGGILAVVVGVVSFRQMDDRTGVPLWRDLVAAVRSEPYTVPRPAESGFFVALEGGDGAGKSTQAELLAEWLRKKGHEVVVTHEPGGTRIGGFLRDVLLDVANAGLSSRTEALLYAADRAEHVDSVIRPALERGAIVVTDRYVDSSLAYQGAGRELSATEVARLSRWATEGLSPDLTVVLDIDPEAAQRRSEDPADRLESESRAFHERVRQGFLDLAARDARRYFVVDATLPPEEIAARVQERLHFVLPLSAKEEAAREEAEQRAEEQRRVEEAERARLEEERRAAEERLAEERRALVERCRIEAEERERVRLAEEAKRREAEEAARRRAEAEEARRLEAEAAARRRAEAEEARRLEQELAARRRAEAEEARRRAEEARRKAEQVAGEVRERARLEAEARRRAEQATQEIAAHGRHAKPLPEGAPTRELPAVGDDTAVLPNPETLWGGQAAETRADDVPKPSDGRPAQPEPPAPQAVPEPSPTKAPTPFDERADDTVELSLADELLGPWRPADDDDEPVRGFRRRGN